MRGLHRWKVLALRSGGLPLGGPAADRLRRSIGRFAAPATRESITKSASGGVETTASRLRPSSCSLCTSISAASICSGWE